MANWEFRNLQKFEFQEAKESSESAQKSSAQLEDGIN